MPGTITFRPVEANLTHDTDWLGKMDPYCVFNVGPQKVRSQVCRHGGKRPHWEDAVTIQADGNPAVCRVDIMDKDKLRPDDSIASTEIDLSEIQNFGRVSRWYPVYHRRKLAGEILIEAAYQPAMVQQTVVTQPVITQPIITPTVIPTQETFVQEKVITSAPIITNTTTSYTESRGFPLGTELGLGQQQFIGQSYEIPTSNLGTQGLIGSEFIGGQQFIGQNYETTSYTSQSYGLGQNLGGLGLAGSQLSSGTLLNQGLTGLQGSTLEGNTRGYYNAGAPGYANSNLTGLTPGLGGFNSGLTGTDPALIGTNRGLAGSNGLLASKTSALGAQGGFAHGFKRLGGATNAGWSERPGYTLGDVESNPTLQANLDTNGGGFFNKSGRERRAEPYSLSNPGTYGIPHGQTIDRAGHLHPEIGLNRQAPIGQINAPGYTGYPDGPTRGLNAGLHNLGTGYQSGLGAGYQSGLGLQSGFNQGGLQPNLGQGIQTGPNLGLGPNLGQTGIQSGPNLGLGPNLGQGGLAGSRNNIL